MELIKRLDRRCPKKTGKQKQSFGLFLCSYCGNKVERGLSNGKRDNSCGCMSRPKKHGYSKHKLYNVWRNMIDRCYNNQNNNYDSYGGRGITVCKEWQNNIASFIEWAKRSGYRHGLQIDREDNEKGYTPLNCRFVTHTINSRNRRSAKLNIEKAREIRFKRCVTGASYKDLVKEYNVNKSTICGIIKNNLWKESEVKL